MDFLYGQKESYLKELSLKTPQTSLQDEIGIRYNSIADLSKNIADLDIKANLQNTKIGVKDILLFVPQLRSNKIFANNEAAEIKLIPLFQGK